MTPIQKLTNEIESFEVELTKLKSELAAASLNQPPEQSDSAQAITNAFRSAAVATHERIADVQGIRVQSPKLNRLVYESLKACYYKALSLGF